MKKKLVITIFLALIAIFMFVCKCEAVDLDEIISYTTTLSPRDDGTLDIKYNIQWKVLDSTTEGPLEWVKIGIPNQHVDNIKKISDNINKIKYSSSGGNYVIIDFKDKYEAGETVTFEFSIHQSYMYTINNSTGKVSYTFTPGWFEDIEVKQATIKWESKDVTRHTGSESGEYIVWSRALGKNQKLTAKVEYSVSRFNLDYNKQAGNQKSTNSTNSTSNTSGTSMFSIVIIFVLLVIVFTAIIVLEVISPPYYRHGGYGYYDTYYPYRHHHHGGFGGGHHGGFGGGFGGGRRRTQWPEVADILHVHVLVHVPVEDELDVLKKTFTEQI